MKVCDHCGGLYATEPGGEMIAGRICECGAHHASEPVFYESHSAIRHLMQLALSLELHQVVHFSQWDKATQDTRNGYVQGIHRAVGELAKLSNIPEQELLRIEQELRKQPLVDRMKTASLDNLGPGFPTKL